MGVRQVVTGHAADGRSVFVADRVLEPVTSAAMPGTEFLQLWALDAVPQLPVSGPDDAPSPWYPPPGGVRFAFFTLPPEGAGPAEGVDVVAELVALDGRLPGLLAPLEPENPGMHTTQTVDLEVVLAGEVCLELDDGQQKTLYPGDTIVQNGTRHRWTNRGTEPVVMAVVLLGAHRP